MSYAIAERPGDHHLWLEELYVSTDPQQPGKPHAAGETLQYVVDQTDEAAKHFSIPITRQQESLESRFRRLVQAWRTDVGPTSSLTQMAMHPAYQQIIGMGREAIPLLLGELEREPDHWFWALKAIAGVDPVDAGLKGKLDDMAKAWLRWGREQGFRW